jgi:DNA polymerase-3 subunit alpha
LQGIPYGFEADAKEWVLSSHPVSECAPLAKAEDGSEISQWNSFSGRNLKASEQPIFLHCAVSETLTRMEAILQRLARNNIPLRPQDIALADAPTWKLLQQGLTEDLVRESLDLDLDEEALQRLEPCKPKTFADLSAMVALLRPGPIHNGMLDDFLTWKKNEREFCFFDWRVEPILQESRGFLIYHEQVIKIIQNLTGYSVAEADLFRRELIRHERIRKRRDLKEHFVKSCGEKNIHPDDAEPFYESLSRHVGFCSMKANAVGAATVIFRMAYLKANYPEAYGHL